MGAALVTSDIAAGGSRLGVATVALKAKSAPEFRRELIWLTTLRVVVVSTLLLSALLVQSVMGNFFIELNPIYYLVGFTFLLSLVYATLLNANRVGATLATVQLAADLLMITGLVYYSGGLDSPFNFLYIIIILTASIILPPRGGLVMASLSSILYGVLVALIYNGVIPDSEGVRVSPVEYPMNRVYYNLLVAWLAFFAAAFLATYVAEKLRRAGESLERERADLATMQVFYEDVINSMKNGLVTTDRDLRVMSVNGAGQAILGRRIAALRGVAMSEIIAVPQDLVAQAAGAGADGLRFERTYLAPARGRRHLELVASELHDQGGDLRGYTFVIQDLTMVKELERELRQSERLAAVGRMAAGIAHEIRNPLASMSGSIQVLKGELALAGEQARLMDIVLSESDRLNRTIEDFLFYAKPSPALRRPVDLARLVDETVILARNSEELKPGQQILVDREPNLQAMLAADQNQLKQVFWNLVRNALGAMPEGGTLRVRLEPGGPRQVAVVFEDEGPGFQDADSERLFEPFHGSTSGGSGLGLAIVYRIVTEHGGSIALESLEPRGARVKVSLPLGALAESPAGSEVEA